MKNKNLIEIVKYIIVGGFTTLFSMAVFYGCTWTFLDGTNPFQLQIANILSWIGGVSFAYITNKIFVFSKTNNNIFKELCSFISSRVVTLLADMFLMFILSTLLGINYNIAKIINTIIVVICNYIFSKFFVFKNKN